MSILVCLILNRCRRCVVLRPESNHIISHIPVEEVGQVFGIIVSDGDVDLGNSHFHKNVVQ